MDRTTQLGEKRILPLLLKFSIPAMIGMIVNALYNIVDRIFIGNSVGSVGIAGITIGFPIMLFILACSMLIGFGSNALLSLKLGARKHEEAELIIGNGMTMLIIFSLVISVFGLIFLVPLLKLFGASDVVLPYSYDYMQIILIGTIFQMVGFGMNNYIRALGSPKTAMATMLIGAILNTILDPLFIFVFGWGVRGAAIATIFSQAVSAAWVLYFFLGNKCDIKLRLKNMRLHLKTVSIFLVLGMPSFLMQLAASLFNTIMNKSLSIYGGDIAVSAMGIVSSVNMMILMPIFGINQGVQPIVGYNYGAKNYGRVKETLKLGIIGASIIVFIGFLATRIFPEQIISLFNRNDADLIKIGARALRVFLFCLPLLGFQIVGASYFQAVGKPREAMTLTLSRQVLFLIPAMLILPKYFGLDGIFYAGPVADFLAFFITAIWLTVEIKNLQKQHVTSGTVLEDKGTNSVT
ncbi:MAG: MATE family efflux transporter [Saccharofermentanales bacterium]